MLYTGYSFSWNDSFIRNKFLNIKTLNSLYTKYLLSCKNNIWKTRTVAVKIAGHSTDTLTLTAVWDAYGCSLVGRQKMLSGRAKKDIVP